MANSALTLRLFGCLVLPPLLWAGNAVVGRYAATLISPMLLNFLRWGLALVLLSALYYRRRLSWHQIYPYRRWFICASLFGIGLYNSLQYLALHSSSATNVTLMAASMPLWMMLNGRLFFKQAWSIHQLIASCLSIVGVLLVLTRGELTRIVDLSVSLGDVYMLIAACCWSWYSWMLTRAPRFDNVPTLVFLLAQLSFGLAWAGSLALIEFTLDLSYLKWNSAVLAVLIFVALGPSLLAYRCWGEAVAGVGPTMAAIFANFTPLFAASLSGLLLNEPLQAYQILAFVCMLIAVIISASKKSAKVTE